MWTPSHYKLIIIFLTIVLVNNVNAQYENNPCNHIKKGVPGICKKLENCLGAIKDFRLGIFPQNCGFVGTVAIVCCPLEALLITTTTIESQIDEPLVGEKSKQACARYNEIWFSRRDPDSIFRADYSENKNCPFLSQTVVYNGSETNLVEFPHMALLGYGTWPDNYNWACGGSLISEKYVLTAAHCLFSKKYGEVQFVRLGDVDYADPDDDQHLQQINVKNRIKYPSYRPGEHYDDIALLELEYPALLNIHVNPTCLYTLDPNGRVTTGIVTGWGNTEDGISSSKLLKGNVHYFSPERCGITYADIRQLPRHLDNNSQICFGPLDNQTDTCQGDSGGPIQIYNTDILCSYYIFGITSFGISCGNNGIPGVYVNLFHYISWIEGIVWS